MKVLQISKGAGGEFEIVMKLGKFLQGRGIETSAYCFTNVEGWGYIKNFKLLDETIFSPFLSEGLKSDIVFSDAVIQHFIFNFASLLLMLILRVRFQKKIIGVYHSRLDGRGGKIKSLLYLIRRILILNVSTFILKRIVFLTQDQKNYFRMVAFSKGIFDKKAEVISNFVESGDILQSRTEYLIGGELQVVFIGSLSKLKGFDDLLELARICENYPIHFNVIGTGRRKGYLPSVKNINYFGFVDRENLSKHLQEMDVLLLPSYSEAFPMSILESMAKGLVVLISDI